MAITKITRSVRPNTTVPFFRDAAKAAKGNGTYPNFDTMNDTLLGLIDSGKATHDVTYSDDELTETRTWNFDDVETLSAAETAVSLASAIEFQTYRIANSFTIPSFATAEDRAAAWSLNGINQPYKVTTTYTFPAGETYIDTFTSSLEAYEHYGKIHDLYIDGTNVIVIHQYLNSDDQTANPYLDMFYASQLVEKNVTRTIKYELV